MLALYAGDLAQYQLYPLYDIMLLPLLKNCAGGILHSGLSVSECMHESVSRKPCEHHVSKTNEGNFTQFWSQMYLGPQISKVNQHIYVLISFWGQRSRLQQAMTRKPCEHHISKINE